MRGASRRAPVNLARRPFVNRRPVARLAALLWLLGIGLLVVNVRLYAGHWRGKAMNNQRLAEVNRELEAQSRELASLDQKLQQVNLRRQNRQTAFLNTLITHRTFPWSALFDDLEEVLPRQVRLLSVQPSVTLAPERATPRRQRPRRPRRSDAAAAAETAAEDTAAEDEPGPVRTPLKRNEVSLALTAVAENEDALYELIDRLYASSSFRAPFLPGENRNLDSGSTQFSFNVVYLTRPDLPPEAPPELAEEGGGEPRRETAGPPQTEAGKPEETRSAEAPPPRRSEDPEAAADSDRPAPASATEDESVTGGGVGQVATAPGRPPAADRGDSIARRRATPARRAAAGIPPVGAPAAEAPSAGAPTTGAAAEGPSAGTAAEPPPGTAPRVPRAEPEGREEPTGRGGDRPPAGEPPEEDEPPFADPPASATPRLRRGSQVADAPDPRSTPRSRARFAEVAA